MEKTTPSKLVQQVAAQPVQDDGLNLFMPVGERLHLEITATGEHLWGELAGFKQGKFLLVWLPALAAHRNALAENKTVTVRGMNADFQLCGFTTTVTRPLLNPHPLLFLSFPAVYEKLHLRRHDRVRCFLPALIIFDGNEYKAMVVNLSQGGARIVLDLENTEGFPDLCEGLEVFLVCKAVDDGLEVYMRSLIRSAHATDARMALGLEFLDMIGDSKTIIQSYVASIKEYCNLK